MPHNKFHRSLSPLSIPLNGFRPIAGLRAELKEPLLSIPLNGFMSEIEAKKAAEKKTLSIPLNGFLCRP